MKLVLEYQFYWRSPESGAFNSIEKMVKGRQNIRNSIVEYTSYANVQQNGFGFPLTAEMRMNIERKPYIFRCFGDSGKNRRSAIT